MLSAKTEVSTKLDITRSTSSVPTIEIAPISSGIDAATTPRKTKQQQQRQDREGDQLGLGQVLAGLVVGLVEAGGEAADRRRRAARATSGLTSSAAMPPASSTSLVER